MLWCLPHVILWCGQPAVVFLQVESSLRWHAQVGQTSATRRGPDDEKTLKELNFQARPTSSAVAASYMRASFSC